MFTEAPTPAPVPLHNTELPIWTAPEKPRRAFPIVVLVALLMVGMSGGAFWFFTRDKGPSYPKQWDARVADLVPVVERLRGLTFEHPVAVNFYSVSDFKKRVTASAAKLTKKDRQELEGQTASLRALGLVDG